jgi:hypothetical protein
MLLVRREAGKPLARNLLYAFGEAGNWKPLTGNFMLSVRRETGKPMTGNLLYAFGETGNWKTIDKKLTLCFR